MAEKQVEFRPDDFTLVQQDAVIMDKKLDSKPTTFLKDAFRRFCKNKSSVAGAIILAILLMSALIFFFYSHTKRSSKNWVRTGRTLPTGFLPSLFSVSDWKLRSPERKLFFIHFN